MIVTTAITVLGTTLCEHLYLFQYSNISSFSNQIPTSTRATRREHCDGTDASKHMKITLLMFLTVICLSLLFVNPKTHSFYPNLNPKPTQILHALYGTQQGIFNTTYFPFPYPDGSANIIFIFKWQTPTWMIPVLFLHILPLHTYLCLIFIFLLNLFLVYPFLVPFHGKSQYISW